MNKIKVIHGNYVEKPKCKVCGTDVKHEWLGGDYTLIICDKKECYEQLKLNHYANRK